MNVSPNTGEADAHGGCDHCHESSLPRGWLVGISGSLTGAGLPLQGVKVAPGGIADAAFILATLAGGALVFPAAWQSLPKLRLGMNVLMAGAGA